MSQAMGDIPDTQEATQSQNSDIFAAIESQPLSQNNIPWGRLYSRKIIVESVDSKVERVLAQNTMEHRDLSKVLYKIGRADENDLCVTEDILPKEILFRISKVHFEIFHYTSDHACPVFIKDLSRNGTFVNGIKIGFNKIAILSDNDKISMFRPEYRTFTFKDMRPSEAYGFSNEINSKYYVSRRVGSGACGTVYLVYDKSSCEKYAMKYVQKNRILQNMKEMNVNDSEKAMNEVRILKSLNHPCVIRMHDIVNNADSVYMILDFMKGGDLLSRISEKGRLSERIAKLFFYQICHAVKYLHDKGITHRDLKPDNVLLETEDEETLVKVTDFGLSKFVQNDSIMRTICGTVHYVAPEVLLTGGKGSYTKKVDIWSLGVMLYTCLSGRLPFSDEYGGAAVNQIRRGDFSFSDTLWRNVSVLAKALILKMLTVRASQRPTIDNVLQHEWFKDLNVIKKAKELMGINATHEDENFNEPPAKRIRR